VPDETARSETAVTAPDNSTYHVAH
jgi:hypothetical protein